MPKFALEHDRAAVLRDIGPQHAAGSELRDLLRLAGQRLHPDVFRAAPVGHVIQLRPSALHIGQ
jgi:hypothetical protein